MKSKTWKNGKTHNFVPSNIVLLGTSAFTLKPKLKSVCVVPIKILLQLK